MKRKESEASGDSSQPSTTIAYKRFAMGIEQTLIPNDSFVQITFVLAKHSVKWAKTAIPA
jgi:hypothetical protein